MQCEKAIPGGKRKDLPKRLVTNLNAQKHYKENKALEKASSQTKAGEKETSPSINEASSSIITTTVAKARAEAGKGKACASKEKKEREKQEKPREEQAERVAIESDVDSDGELLLDEDAKGTTEQKSGTGPAVQSRRANRSATPMDADPRIPMEK